MFTQWRQGKPNDLFNDSTAQMETGLKVRCHEWSAAPRCYQTLLSKAAPGEWEETACAGCRKDWNQ